MATPREHIDQIRRTKFSIGGEPNPLIEDLHQATKHLSAELYAKDVHFFMELIQNAEDNEYSEGVDPSLEFVLTSHDITGTGAPATLLIFNNERGFSSKNIESICSVGRSTKKGNRKRGYIGEKGIGFKSVFLITAQPYIFSNGYQIRFSENPCPHCGLGYIVPEWVEENPSLADLKNVYGSGATLPTTTLVLPLKPDKVTPVKLQLSTVHPEVLLFLSKIKRLSVREDNEEPRLNTVCAIAITSETNFVTRKNIDAESYTIHLSAEENGDNFEKECSYYMWKQKFPVKEGNKVERRMDVEEWAITLAFPNQERLNRGMSSPGVYAFLPTEMVTNFPFIIQADFLLASSRETILLDDKWNQGILDCVSAAFIDAFTSLVKMTEDAPVSSLPRMFEFLPIKSSSYAKLNSVRESIRATLVQESIVPGESYTKQKFFHKPTELGRLKPVFWDILEKARRQGVGLHNLSSHGCFILSSSFDKAEYDEVLNFLGVKPVNREWYAKCIQSSNLILGVSEDIYLELLQFVADNWSEFSCTDIKNIPLLKYVDHSGNVLLCSISDSIQSTPRNNGRTLCVSQQYCHAAWLIDSNKEFSCGARRFFLPKSVQEALSSSKKAALLDWLVNHVKVAVVNVYSYAKVAADYLYTDRRVVVAYAQFLYHSSNKGYLSEQEVAYLCATMPLVDKYGSVTKKRNGVLVPANGSKWAKLIGSNPWRGEDYIELAEDYLFPSTFACEYAWSRQLMPFLGTYVGASDIPLISPPNTEIPTVSSPLTRENAFLLLDWIRELTCGGNSIPNRFLKCIKEGSWLRIRMNGSTGYKPPSESFQLASSWGNVLQNGSVFVDIPLLDESFYGDEISQYKEELRTIGVMFDYIEACGFIGKHLMSLAASSSLTRSNVLSILKFIRFLRGNYLPPDEFIKSIEEGRWLRTSHGDRSPVGSVLRNDEWETASQISNLPFIDEDYYGGEIAHFRMELQSLGVLVGFDQNYQLVVDCLKSPTGLISMGPEAAIFILQCIQGSSTPSKVIQALKRTKCWKTNFGYRPPEECFLCDTEWGSLLEVLGSFPVVDCQFYGSRILSYKVELKQIGVVVDFEDAAKAFARCFRQQASVSSITKENALSFLSWYRELKKTSRKLPSDLKNCIRDVEWLRTLSFGFQSPRHCILSCSGWESISPIARLPFIDVFYYGEEIFEFEKELKKMHVVVDVKDGLKFVYACLRFPEDPCFITPANVQSLLECIRMSLQESNNPLPEALLKKVSQNWLKTYAGYKMPKECSLFDSEWALHLKCTDGPFIDEDFYGFDIVSYSRELNAIGVAVGLEKGCPLVASHLDIHSEFSTIARIYNFLRERKWEPATDAARRIWVPDGAESGEWVSPGHCVLHDKHGLFGMKLNVLEKHYGPELLFFFAKAFNVKSHPSVDDYCKLWKDWESSGKQLSQDECCSFWDCVMKHRNAKTEKTLVDSLAKLPAISGTDGAILVDKRDVFIADDLRLKDLFEKNSLQPIFVWYPQPSLPSLPLTKLFEVYRKVGVRTLSEAVQKEEVSLVADNVLQPVKPVDTLIKKGLVKVILGFLAISLNMEAKERHTAVQCLLNLSVLETEEPVNVGYSVSLSSGEVINVKARGMVWWDRETSKLLMQKIEKDNRPKNLIEYATYFSNVISQGLLWDKEDHVSALSELIKLAFLLDFNEEAVDFLMKSKNLQIFMEDVEFLGSAFPSE